MTESSVVFITRVKDNTIEVLLGRRKSKNYASGKWNGFGGKKEGNETPEDIAVRETFEECGIRIPKEKLCKVAEIAYQEPQGDWLVTAYLVTNYKDEKPKESDEMKPKWFPISQLPFDEMWENDKLWLPRILNGEKLKGVIVNGSEGRVKKYSLTNNL